MKRSLGLLLPLLLLGCNREEEEPVRIERLTILHTNDWQSHLLGQGPNAEYTPGTTDDDLTIGGIARIKTKADEIRATADADDAHAVVMYDAGDWMAGALFQLLATSDATELQMFQEVGYDAVTLGNHEFDWGPQVLGQLITAGDAAGVDVPILSSNVVPNTTDAGDDLLEAHFDSGRIQDTMIHEVGPELTVGLFGLIGDEAQSVTPAIAPAGFADPVAVSTAKVAELRDQGVDLVISLNHVGVEEDREIAAAVDGIDVIVGGHSHTALMPYEVENGTVIVQAGSNTLYLGQLDLIREGDHWVVDSYALHEMNDSIAGDPDITTAVDGFIAALEAGPLLDIGYDFDEPITSIADDMPTVGCAETGLGDFITDAYRAQVEALDPSHPVDLAFESQGVIRNGMLAGDSGIQAFSDIFRVMPLGFGNDDVPGYALVDFYVTAAEVKTVCEVTASVSPQYGCSFFIEVSGMRCNLDMNGFPFKTMSLDQWNGSDWEPVNTSSGNTQLYHVVVDSYVASLMSLLEEVTGGALVITPKDVNGTPYTSVDDMVFDADPNTAGVQEYKLWQALIDYAETFPDVDSDGIPDIPARYTTPDGRIVGYE